MFEKLNRTLFTFNIQNLKQAKSVSMYKNKKKS